jgi:hypothetical protein
VPKKDVKATLTLTQEDEAELARVLDCKPADFSTVLGPYGDRRDGGLKERDLPAFLGLQAEVRPARPHRVGEGAA